MPGFSFDLGFGFSPSRRGLRATLNLDLRSMATADFLTVSRASVKYGLVNGVYTSFPVDAPASTDTGLTIHQSRTNSIPNNSMQGAVPGVLPISTTGTGGVLPTGWGNVGGSHVEMEVLGTGVENGIDYMDVRFNGVTNASFNVLGMSGAIPASAGQLWSGAMFCALIGGDLTNVASVSTDMRINGGPGSTQTPMILSGALTRQPKASATVGEGASSVSLALTFGFSGSSVPVDLTLRIGWPQSELGGMVTSPIRTTGTAATRAADDITLSDISFFQDGQPGTIFAEWIIGDPSASTAALFLSDGSLDNRMHIGTGPAIGRGVVVADGVVEFDRTAGPTLAAGDTVRVAMAFAEDDVRLAVNGVLSTLDTDVALPTGINQCRVGSITTVNQVLNEALKKVAYYPIRLSDAQLIALTSIP